MLQQPTTKKEARRRHHHLLWPGLQGKTRISVRFIRGGWPLVFEGGSEDGSLEGELTVVAELAEVLGSVEVLG